MNFSSARFFLDGSRTGVLLKFFRQPYVYEKFKKNFGKATEFGGGEASFRRELAPSPCTPTALGLLGATGRRVSKGTGAAALGDLCWCLRFLSQPPSFVVL